MKKLTLFASLMLFGLIASAQNYFQMFIDDIEPDQVFEFCLQDYNGVVIVDTICDYSYQFHWMGGSLAGTYDFEEWGSVLTLIPDDGWNHDFVVYYLSCEGDRLTFVIKFHSFSSPAPWFPDYVWKHEDEVATLVAPDNASSYSPYYWYYEWSTGEVLREIEVADPGIYWVRLYNNCGEAIDSVEVRNCVELYRATVDLETNLNKTTWQVIEEQAEYISEVKVYRDGLLVGTAPYQDGYFLDAIGSGNAARNYSLVSVTPEGEDSPIESYVKGTIHTTYYQDVNGNLNMTWNIPYVEEGAQGTLTYFQICKYDSNTGEITVVDQVNASITDYTCGVNQFDGGQAVIAAVFSNNKGLEELSFSNLTTDILGVEEDGPSTGSGTLTVYPNPAKDRVTIEGTGTMTITNTLGQTIMTKEIDGKVTVELPQGLYFVKMNGITRKIVVE